MYFAKNKEILTANDVQQDLARQKRWNVFCNRERHFEQMSGLEYNAAARLPQEAPVSFDRTIKKLMTGDEGNVIVNDLLPLAKSLHPGKLVDEYAKVSDSGEGKVSLHGKLSKLMDAPQYDYEGTLSLVHEDAFGLTWRERLAYQSEDFDAIVDMQENSVRAVRRSLVGHVIDGVAGVEYRNTQAYGIKNSPNTVDIDTGASGLNVDLTDSALTYANAEKVFINVLTQLQGAANNVEMDITFYVSADIWFNLIQKKSNDTAFATFLDQLRAVPGVADIKRTNGTNALDGNEMIAMALGSQFIQPIVAMNFNTMPIPRQTEYSDWNWVTWGIFGLHIKADYAGRSGVAYIRDIT